MSAIVEFEKVVDAVYGVYLDSTTGFSKVNHWIETQQRNLFEWLKHTHPELTSIDYLDGKAFTYGEGDPNKPEAVELHRCTQKEYKLRNSENGLNYRFIGNMALVAIYQYWEDHYRKKIALKLGLKKEELKEAIMGDIRLLRKSIIHHAGIALKDVENCEILQWYKEGDDVFVDKEGFKEIVFHIKQMLLRLKQLTEEA
jgi:hypothetical protein